MAENNDRMKQVVEALIFASDFPAPVKQIQIIIEEISVKEIRKLVDSLNHDYNQTERSFQIVEVAGGYQMVSREKFAQWVRKLFQGRIKTRLSQAALETLSVVAFKQPVSRTEIDAIRGVNSGGVLKNLLERKLIKIAGRADGPGKPLIYATTKEFLHYFGINDISDLPKPREIEELLKEDDVSDEIERINISNLAESAEVKTEDVSDGKVEESKDAATSDAVE